MSLNTPEFTEKVIEWIEERGGHDITVIDLDDFPTAVADNFIIASGSSERQVKAIVDNIEDKAFELGQELKSREGVDASKWILLDYYDTIIHIFHERARSFYDLERLWKEDDNVTIV